MVDISVSLVGRLVREQFPQWADLPIEPVEFDGWDNRTFRLGEEMIVRLPSTEVNQQGSSELPLVCKQQGLKLVELLTYAPACWGSRLKIC